MKWRLRAALLALLCVAAVAVAYAWNAHEARRAAPAPVFSTPIAALGFAPPAPGSYALERILRVPDGPVLDSDGSAHRLHEFTTGKITLFSFIYTYCTDATGCPLAYATLHALQDMVTRDSALRGQVRFVSMSFDPAFDTPAMMRSYGGADAHAGPGAPWHFLTTVSAAHLAPLLAGFGQDVSVAVPGQSGQRPPVLSHLLKVYLIDRAGMVREIYAPAYLHPGVLYNDLVTVALEDKAVRVAAQAPGTTWQLP